MSLQIPWHVTSQTSPAKNSPSMLRALSISMNVSSTMRCGADSRSPLVAPRRSKPEAPTRTGTTVRCAVASSPNDYADLPPPPGDLGLPFIGETLGACVAHTSINARLPFRSSSPPTPPH
jgi:hypothetical protein